jgi:hypothetical protein
MFAVQKLQKTVWQQSAKTAVWKLHTATRAVLPLNCSAMRARMLVLWKLRKTVLATVSEISVKNANRVITLHQNASWKTTMYFVMVTALLTSCTIEVQEDLLSITNEDCTNTGENTEQWGDFRTGTAQKISCTAFPVQLDKTQQQRSVKLHQCHTQH